MLTLVHDADALSVNGASSQPENKSTPSGPPELGEALDILVETLEDLNVCLAKAYIETIERRRSGKTSGISA